MKEFKYVITDAEGIHARPATMLVKKAAGFKSDINIDGTKILPITAILAAFTVLLAESLSIAFTKSVQKPSTNFT